ncbi:MAG: peptide deformylase [Clostridia bacterium]|nr:peptide deformylase [Clostridia bacterium]
MAVREVIQTGDEFLRRKCRNVTKFDESLWALLKDLHDTVKAENGAGLAAPQIGVDLRVVVIDVEEGYYEFINPVIVYKKGEQTGAEGCLSVRGKQGTVTRPQKVKVVFRDRKGKKHTVTAEGFFARACCHETDHLDGILYTDIAIDVYDLEDEGK